MSRATKNKQIDVSALITQPEAAQLRGSSYTAINDLVRRGRLRSVELFGRKLVYRAEVLAFKKQKTGPKPAKGKRKG